MSHTLPASKKERTRERLQLCALELFELQGYEATTVGHIAERAGVTPMTFFRHFGSKARVLLDDPYDPLIAAAVAAQPRDAAPLARTVGGLRQAWESVVEPASDVQRRRVRVIASTPALWAEMQADNRTTEQLIVDQLVADGARPLDARVSAAATLAAVAAALLEWAQGDGPAIGTVVLGALAVLEHRR